MSKNFNNLQRSKKQIHLVCPHCGKQFIVDMTVSHSQFDGEQSLHVLKLSNRALNVLHKAGITTMGKLTSKSRKELFAVKNCGKKIVYEIEVALSRHNLCLRRSLSTID